MQSSSVPHVTLPAGGKLPGARWHPGHALPHYAADGSADAAVCTRVVAGHCEKVRFIGGICEAVRCLKWKPSDCYIETCLSLEGGPFAHRALSPPV
jgi:hypothetical protein